MREEIAVAAAFGNEAVVAREIGVEVPGEGCHEIWRRADDPGDRAQGEASVGLEVALSRVSRGLDFDPCIGNGIEIDACLDLLPGTLSDGDVETGVALGASVIAGVLVT